MSLVERGELGLDTTARSLLGDDLPLIDCRVTIEQLLAHVLESVTTSTRTR
jgi:hypothetical protein